MEIPPPDRGGGDGFRGEAPKFNGRKGETYSRWKRRFQEFLLSQQYRREWDAAELFRHLPYGMAWGTPAYYEFEAQLPRLIEQATSVVPAGEGQPPATVFDAGLALQLAWQWLDAQYGVPDALELLEFTQMRRDLRDPAHQSVSGWGACVMGKFLPLKNRALATLSQANKVFLDGLEDALRLDPHLSTFIVDNPLNTCELSELVARAEKTAQGRAGYAALTSQGTRKPSALDISQLNDAAKRKMLRQLAAETGQAVVPAGQLAPAPQPGQRGKWCDFHRNATHNTADCRALQQQQQQQLRAQVPGLTAAAGQLSPNPGAGPPRPRPTATPPVPQCSFCGKTRHTEERCWAKHPELAPAWHTQASGASAAAHAAHQLQGQVAGLHQQLASMQLQLSQAMAARAPSPAHAGGMQQGSTGGHGGGPPDPWATDHAAHTALFSHAARQELPQGFGVLPPQPRTPGASPLSCEPAQSPPAVGGLARRPRAEVVRELTQKVQELGTKQEHLTLLLRELLAQEAETEERPQTGTHAPAVPEAEAPAAAPERALLTAAGQQRARAPELAGSAATPPSRDLQVHLVAQGEQDRRVEDYNALETALWYLEAGTPAKEGLSVYDGKRRLTVANPMVDTGANCIIANAEWCEREGLAFAHSDTPLDGALGQSTAMGTLLTPLTLALGVGTPHETRVTVGGKHGLPVLISSGTGHVYDLLLGNAFTHRVGGGVDLFTREFTFRPHLQTGGDAQVKVALPLRPHALRAKGQQPAPSPAAHAAGNLIACSAHLPQPPGGQEAASKEPSHDEPGKKAAPRDATAASRAPVWGGTHTRRTRKPVRSRRGLLLAVLLLTVQGVVAVAGGVDPGWAAAERRERLPPDRPPCPVWPAALTAIGLPSPTCLVQSSMPAGVQADVAGDGYTTDEEFGWVWGNHPETTAEQRDTLRRAIAECNTSFAYSVTDLPGYSGGVGPYRIELDTDEELIDSPRRYSKAEREVIDSKCEELLQAGLIQPQLLTRYAACPVVVAKKDANGAWTDARFCVDERRLNLHTKPDRYTMPLPELIFQDVGTARFFSKIDLRAGFHQIPIAAEDQEKTTFWWGNKTYSYTRLCFGLRNATAHFCRVMDHEIRRAGLQGHAAAFVDDVLVYSNTFEEHVQHVTALLRALHEVGLRAHPEKSVFGAGAVEFLGHVVSHYGLSPHEAKVAAIRALPEPRNLTEMQSVLGFMNYYRLYVPNYSAIARPLTQLTSKNTPWEWTELHTQAYAELKNELCAEGRALRRAEDNLPFILYTDWSQHGVGAVLAQRHPDGKEYMVGCISRALNKHEANYSSYEGEMLAAVWAIKTLRPYLHGVPFTVVTDHQPLTNLMKSQNLTGKHARWALSLQDYEFTIVHRPGRTHANADVPSRFPRGCAFDGTGARLDGAPNDQPASKQPAPLQAAATCMLWAPPALSAPPPACLHTPHAPCMPQHLDDLLAGHCSAHEDSNVPPDLGLAPELARALRSQATACAAATHSSAPQPAPAPATHPPTVCWSDQPRQLQTTPLTAPFFADAAASGVVVLELCGGICAGLDMALRNGLVVRSYLYADTDPKARAAAAHRVRSLAAQYPGQLDPSAEHAMFALPQDVACIMRSHLHAARAPAGVPWLVVAGWPCQDLSPAGSGRGLHGARSSLYFQVERVVAELQQLHSPARVAYILENAAMQHSFNHTAQATSAYAELCTRLGQPVCLDAARFSARAHRLRNYWTNLAPAQQLQCAADAWHRTPGLLVDDILEPGRTAQEARRSDSPPFYPANKAGHPLSALPTIVAYPGSHAYRNGGPGMVWDANLQRLDEPTALERERALGYACNATAAAGLSERDRRALLGNCIDQHALQALFALARAVTLLQPDPPARARTPSHGCQLGGGDRATACTATDSAALAAAQAEDSGQPCTDIWQDAGTMHYLQHGTHGDHTTAPERRRISKRAAKYLKMGDALFRVFSSGARRRVPKPEERLALVQQAHDNTGHFGARRTTSILAHSYWWYGMAADVADFVAQCELCDKVKCSFDAPAAQLHPLPISGLFYRWGVDLCGPFPTSGNRDTYCMVCIEHFSKHVVLVPLPSKEPKHTAAAFLSQVLGKFGSCAEVVTDGGGEFQGEFDALLRDALIDHRTTRANNPQADGLAERAVQTVKRSLRKHVEQQQDATAWDAALPWIALGYNTSAQKSTGFSPYHMLHATQPVVPPAIRERMLPPLDFDQPTLAADQLLARAEAVRRAGVIAGGNLLIAQHRDTLRYGTVRSGSYHPRLRRYEPGDFVYVRSGEANNSLDTSHFSRILRVVAVKPSGNLEVVGACGSKAAVNVTNCAPCHLPNIDARPLQGTARPAASLPCEICRFPDREHLMLLCDSCSTGWHTTCLGLPAVPSDPVWVCPRCLDEGVDPATVQPPPEPSPPQRRDALFPAGSTKKRDAAAEKLHGRRVELADGRTGTARFISAERRPYYFDIELDDGSTLHRQSATVVRRRLLAEAAAAHSAVATAALPERWDLQSAEGVRAALQHLMPGTWSQQHMSRLANEVRRVAELPHAAPRAVTEPAEVKALAAFLDFSLLGAVLDPWAGSGRIKDVLGTQGVAVLANDLNPAADADMHADALQPAFYESAARTRALDAIVASPWFTMLDLALPLAVHFARSVACVHVPGHYVTDAHPNRAAYLQTLMAAGRLHILWNLPKGPSGRRCGWLLVFASSELRERLIRPECRLAAPFSLAPRA